MEELLKKLGSLKDLRKIKAEAKKEGFEPRKENHKYWNYSFYNKETDKFFAIHWQDKNNFSISGR